MTLQFAIRRDRFGWTVFDRWTGEPVVIQHAVKSGMSQGKAERLAARLNLRNSEGDRRILQ